MAKTYHSSWASVDGGKFRLTVTAKFSDSKGIVVTPVIEIDDAFKKSHDYEFTYYKNDQTKTTVPAVNVNKKSSDDKKVKSRGKHKISGCSSFSVKDAAVSKAMSLKIAGKTVKISGGTIKNTKDKPNGLDDMSLETLSTTKWRISVGREKANQELDQPVTRIYLEQSNYGKTPVPTSEWSQVYQHNISADYDAFDYSFDVDVEENEVYRFRTRVSGTTSGTEVYSPYITLDYAYYTRPSETQLNYDDNEKIFSWDAEIHDIDHGIVKGWHIYRSTSLTNKGTLVAEIDAVNSQTHYYWQETESMRGKNFYYRLYAWNYDTDDIDLGEVQESIDATPVSVLGEPYTPSAGVSFVVYYDSNGYAVIKLNGPIDSSVEEVNVYRVVSGSATNIYTFTVADIDWTDVSTYTYTDSSAPENSSYYITFVNDAGESEPSETTEPTGTRRPNPPTLESPVNNQVVMLTDGSVNAYWTHQSLDGSPQSKVSADYRLSESDAWTEFYYEDSSSMMGVNYCEINFEDLNIYSATPFYWRVRTASGTTWSDYSESMMFNICETPELNIIDPEEDIYTLPLQVEFEYTDTNPVNTIKTATLSILREGEVVKQKVVNGSDLIVIDNHLAIDLDGYLFEDMVDYNIRIDVLSDMGIKTSAEMNLVVSYAEAKEGSLMPIIDNDSETGYGYITIARDSYDEEGDPITPAEVTQALLYRTANGESELIGEVYDDYYTTDFLAPINMDYQYKLYQLYSDGTASITEVEGFNTCDDSFIYWGKNYSNICRARWNPTQSTSLTRPERTLVRYSGRNFPVSYDSKAREENVTFTAELSYAELQDFINMMNAGGTGIWKSVQGRTFYASFDLDWQRIDAKYPVDLYRTTLKITRIEGE